jgi:hypothetical protein
MRSQPRSRIVFLALAGGLALAAGGCAFGPRALERSHGRYYEATRQSEEEQFLRNLVHLRYNETPFDLNVSSIAAQFELGGQAEARPFFLAPNPGTENGNAVFRTFTSILPDLMLSGSTRPTVSFDPSDDSETIRRSLTPIPADTLALLTQTSWPVSVVMRLWVQRLNGVPNAPSATGPSRCEPPDFARFRRLAELIQIAADRELASLHSEERLTEVSGPFPPEAVTPAAAVEAAKSGLEYRPREGEKTWGLFRRERRLVVEVSPEAIGSPEVAEITQLLNLVPGQRRYEMVVAARGLNDPLYHPIPPTTDVQVVTRSTAQVFFYLANGVEVPPEHLEAGLVRPPVAADGQVFDGRELTCGLFEVHAARGCKPPPTAYLAVRYRGYWYYIDDRDQASKATLALMVQLARLDFGGPRPGVSRGPALTLPVGR